MNMKILKRISFSLATLILITFIISTLLVPSIESRLQRVLQPIVNFSMAFEVNRNTPQRDISLEQEVVSLRAELGSLLYIKQENELLKNALDIQNETKLSPVLAKVVAYDNNFLRNSAVLNVGSNNGIALDQPVIYLGHLIGQIVEVNDTTSKVRFLSDPESSLAVTIGNESNSQGIVKSQYSSQLIVDLVPRLESVSVGQLVYTSGIGNFPPGLFVGEINLVDEGDLFYKIQLSQPFSVRRLHTMFVLTPFQS